MRVVASIEARMGSTRLPGKVMADIRGMPSIARLVNRLKACIRLDDIVLATSTAPADDPLVEWAESTGVQVHRGSEDDVLLRVVESHQKMDSDIVVEITGDCPLLDPEIIDLGIETFLANDCDVVTNVKVPSYPEGADVQVFKTAALSTVEKTVHDASVREHVSLFFYENPQIYRIIHLIAPASYKGARLRFQLDYEEDLKFIRAIYDQLEPKHGGCFGIKEIMGLLDQNQDLRKINAHCIEKPVR